MSTRKKADPMVRLTQKIVKQVDARAKYLRSETGVFVSRTSVVRALLTDALKHGAKKS